MKEKIAIIETFFSTKLNKIGEIDFSSRNSIIKRLCRAKKISSSLSLENQIEIYFKMCNDYSHSTSIYVFVLCRAQERDLINVCVCFFSVLRRYESERINYV